MIRTKSNDLPKWKKMGRGSFRMASGKIIKPNQVFTAKELEIPEAFRNLVIRINPGTEEEEIQYLPQKPAFEVQPITPAVQKILDEFNAETDAVLDKKDIEVQEPVIAQVILPDAEPSEKVLIKAIPELSSAGTGWWNIVQSTTGKILNEKKLRKVDADKMLASLLG